MVGPARSAAAAAIVFLGAACAGAADPPFVGDGLPHVVVISVDGLRANAIQAANAPTLQRLISEGASSLNAQTVLPSNTLPAHVSMLTGMIPSRHGIVWNDDSVTRSTTLDAATVFDLARDAGFRSAMFVGKSKLNTLVHGAAPTKQSIPAPNETWLADKVASQVAAYLAVANPQPNLMFIHLPDVDLKGHEFGWMSAEYLAGVRHADAALFRIWQLLQQTFGEDLTMIVTSDHGGVGTAHYDGSLNSTTVPWIAWGHRVKPGVLANGIRVVDTAPTVLWLMNIAPLAGWDGVAVTTAFESPAPR